MGTPLFTALQSIQAYSAGPNGPLTGTLTTAQTTFLQGVVTTLNSAYSSANNAVAANGVVQQQVTASQASLKAQQTTLTSTLGDLTDADAATAATNLQPWRRRRCRRPRRCSPPSTTASLLSVLGVTTA